MVRIKAGIGGEEYVVVLEADGAGGELCGRAQECLIDSSSVVRRTAR